MEVIVDTNFIISCLKKKIDFVEQLEEQGFKVLVPREVLQEMKDLRTSRISHEDKLAVNLGLELFSGRSAKHISLGNGKVDDALIKKGQEGYHIATLDAVIKRKVPSVIVIFDAQKRVGPQVR